MAERGLMCGSKGVNVWQQEGLYVAASVAVVRQQHRFLDMFSTETPKCKGWSVAGDGLRRGSVKVGTWQSKG